jgi:type VI secretion system protein ImpJ
MAMRRESNERMADFAVADVSLFWLLNALNSAEPVLTELLQTPGVTRNCCTANWPVWPAAC